MKKRALQDERVVALSRKTLSEAYSLLMLTLLAAMLVQQFVLEAPFRQYAAEFFCFFGASAYVVIRRLALGINVFPEERSTKRRAMLAGVVSGLTVAAINGVQNYARYAESYRGRPALFAATLAITFASAAVSAFAVLCFLSYMNDRRQKRILKSLDEEE